MNNLWLNQKKILSTIGFALAGNLTLIFPIQAATITGNGDATFEFDENVNNSSEYGWTINFQPGGGSGAASKGPNLNSNNFVVIAADSTTQWTLSIWNKNGSEDKSNWTMDDTPESKKCSPKHESNSLINYLASVPSSILNLFLGEPALAQTFKGATSGDISCSSSCVPEPITGVILGGLAAGGWMVKRKKQKSV